MKKITTTLVISTMLCLAFTSCDKYHTDRYVGEWDFVTEKKWLKYDEDGVLITTKCDTLYYAGNISLGSSEPKLLIQYSQSDVIATYIDKKGGIYVPSCPCAGYACTRGNFEGKDKMNLHFGWSTQDGFEDHSIIGTKKGGKK